MIDKMMGGTAPGAGAPSEFAGKEKRAAPIAEFEGFVECPLFSEEAKITVGADGLVIAAALDLLPVPYGEIAAFSLADNRVEIQTAACTVTASRMGQNAEWLYQKLYGAYNDAVLKALLVEGAHSFEAEGEYSAEEKTATWQGQTVIRLYEDCLCVLPPSEHARRIPLCFLTGMEKDGFSLTLALATGERYTLQKLGRELDNLERMLTANLRALRERTLAWHKELAPNLGSMQAAMAAKLMPLGTAVPMEKLTAAAPPLATALEEQIQDSRMAQTYPWLRDLRGGSGLTVGALPPPKQEKQEQPAMPGMPGTPAAPAIPGMPTVPAPAQAEAPSGEAAEPAGPEKPKPILWAIAPDRERKLAAVELALADDEAAATYLYRVEGGWDAFAKTIDRALEAAGFQRELILMPDEKLNAPEHLEAAMLVRRTPALSLLRRCFAERAIHSSPDRWRRDIEKCRTAAPQAQAQTAPEKSKKFCTSCGATLAPDAKFCGQCGSPQ